jgi:methylamine dehydrogenase accessory protein MauD
MPEVLLLLLRLLIAAILLTAGLAKLADRAGTREALAAFRVPELLSGPLAIVLPLAEIGLAIALIPDSSAAPAAWGAAALFVLFTTVVGAAIARGELVDCHCFGGLHSAPVGWRTLARNGLLTAAAIVAAAYGSESAWSRLGELSDAALVAIGSGVLVATVLVIGGMVFLRLLRRHGRLLERIDELEAALASAGAPWARPDAAGLADTRVGQQAPEFELPYLDGRSVTLADLRALGRPVLLLFTDPGCGPCTALLPDVGRWQGERADRLTVAIVSRGEIEENRAKAEEHGLHTVLVQGDREVSEAYGSNGTPSAVVVAPDGSISSEVAPGADAIRGLVERFTMHGRVVSTRFGADRSPAPGDPAPALELVDLDGNPVLLHESRGREALLLFWNPACGFCARMLDDLRLWDRDPEPGDADLVLVFRGSEEEAREMGIGSTIVLDPDGAVAEAYRATGTPMAVRIGADGRIASGVAAGAAGFFSLAGAPVAAA